MSAPVLHPHDILRTPDGQLHTVDQVASTGPLVTEWTGQQPHPLADKFRVVYSHHPRSA